MEIPEENRMIDVLQHVQEDVIITLEIRDNRIAAKDPAASHISQRYRATYPAYLVSEVMSFNGVMPDGSFGELSS